MESNFLYHTTLFWTVGSFERCIGIEKSLCAKNVDDDFTAWQCACYVCKLDETSDHGSER